MSDYLRAGETIARLAIQYEDMVLASKVLTEIGSVDNHLKEIYAERDHVLAELAVAKEAVATEQATFRVRVGDHLAERDAWEKTAAAERAALDQDKTTILEAARLEASALMANAVSEAQALREAQDAYVADAQADVATLHLVRDQLQTDVTGLEGLRDAAAGRYEAILATIKAMSEPKL